MQVYTCCIAEMICHSSYYSDSTIFGDIGLDHVQTVVFIIRIVLTVFGFLPFFLFFLRYLVLLLQNLVQALPTSTLMSS